MGRIETFEDIKRLVEDHIEENMYVEFKKEFLRPANRIVKEIVAFANARGGELIIGIEERDGTAAGLSPIEKRPGIREQIAQVIDTNTDPKLEDYEIIVIDDEEDTSKAYVVVRVKKSPKAPHMDTSSHKYYIRRGNRAEPMIDNEVRGLLFRRGIMRNLLMEIESNIELIIKTIQFVDGILYSEPKKRKPYLFVPLKEEAWRSFIYSGYSYIAPPEVLNKLTSAYNLIHEVNSIINAVNVHPYINMYSNINVTTPIDENYPTIGEYVPSLIRDKLMEISKELHEVKELLLLGD
ncbi:MAG: ATP-binding protein [Candidatus Marinimicrobia bacterium]|nr:ATP-binding protein [Candidatus Neomarinimicrobiota bacterium]